MTVALSITVTGKVNGKVTTKDHSSSWDSFAEARHMLDLSATRHGFSAVDDGTIWRNGLRVGRWTIV